jgi:GNAT superfamily N-acetyltransferase
MSELTTPIAINGFHDTSTFDCGNEALNEFLQRHALDKQNAKLSRTYVSTRKSTVVGYYTLAHLSVSQEETPKKFGRGMPSTIPAMLMARLAVDLTAQGHGLGRSLFIDALWRTWTVMESGAAPVRLFVVDAKNDDARTFYERFEMTPSPRNPMRLFLLYKDLKLIYEESLP